MTVISSKRVTWTLGIAAFAALAVGSPVAAQDQERADAEPGAVDVAKTPLTDLNLSKDPIPPLLLAAVEEPYTLEGLENCEALQSAVTDLDTILGPDLDLQDEEERGIRTGAVAQSIVGSFIPFRGLVREASGAAKHQREFANAILAGAVRRGFLKGIGQERDCLRPARPALLTEREDHLRRQARIKAVIEAREQNDKAAQGE